MFNEEDFELEYLKQMQCPFCRTKKPDDLVWAYPLNG
jgi:hypothetical protein